MRLFFAVEFDDTLKDAIVNAIDGIRIANPPWRWVARSNIHITLKFLGDTEEEMVPLLVDAVSAVCRETPPFEIVLGGLGGFPNLKKPRVLFYEATRGAPELTSLAQRVDAALYGDLSIPREERPFRAHATVARIKTPIPADLAARLQKARKGLSDAKRTPPRRCDIPARQRDCARIRGVLVSRRTPTFRYLPLSLSVGDAIGVGEG